MSTTVSPSSGTAHLSVLTEQRTPRLRPALPERVIAVVRIALHAEHACRWCGKHHCPDLDAHERLHLSSEQTQRWPMAKVRQCPSCRGDVRVADGCFEVTRVSEPTSAATR